MCMSFHHTVSLRQKSPLLRSVNAQIWTDCNIEECPVVSTLLLTLTRKGQEVTSCVKRRMGALTERDEDRK